MCSAAIPAKSLLIGRGFCAAASGAAPDIAIAATAAIAMPAVIVTFMEPPRPESRDTLHFTASKHQCAANLALARSPFWHLSPLGENGKVRGRQFADSGCSCHIRATWVQVQGRKCMPHVIMRIRTTGARYFLAIA